MMNLVADYKSFVVGAGCVLAVLAFKFFRRILWYPRESQLEAAARRPMPHMGDDRYITIFGLDKEGEHYACNVGIPDASPYVCRVEAFARLCGIKYVKLGSKGGRENPRGKVPFANIKGTMLDDSGHIIAALRNIPGLLDPDAGLTEQQLSTAHLIRMTLFGSLYWVMQSAVFSTDLGQSLLATHFASKFPPVVSTLITRMVFRSMNEQLQATGMGRSTRADICRGGEKDLRSISTILGANKYILGTEEPTSCDCDLYAFVGQLFYDPGQNFQPWVAAIKTELPNLVEHVATMQKLLYPDLQL